MMSLKEFHRYQNELEMNAFEINYGAPKKSIIKTCMNLNTSFELKMIEKTISSYYYYIMSLFAIEF